MSEEHTQKEDEEIRFRLGLKELSPVFLDCFREDQRQQLTGYLKFGTDRVAEIPKRNGVSVRFVLFDSMKLDAKAILGRVEDTEIRIAAVSAGALLYFHEFFTYLMSRVDILPAIGLVAAEKNLSFKFDPPRTYPPTASLSKIGLVHSVLPNDKLRLRFANIMAVTACQFLIFHETAHCVNGHLGQTPLGLGEEDGPTLLPQRDALRSHTLEMDADSFAVCRLFKAPTIFRGVNEEFLWIDALGDHPSGNWLYPSLIALSLLFRIMSQPERLALNQDGLLDGTHPHPAIRSHFCRVLIRRIAIERGSVTAEDWIAALAVKSDFDASRIWESLTHRQESNRMIFFDDVSLRDGFDRVGIYMNQLLDEWELIKATVQKSALIPITPTRTEERESGYECPCGFCQERRKAASKSHM